MLPTTGLTSKTSRFQIDDLSSGLNPSNYKGSDLVMFLFNFPIKLFRRLATFWRQIIYFRLVSCFFFFVLVIPSRLFRDTAREAIYFAVLSSITASSFKNSLTPTVLLFSFTDSVPPNAPSYILIIRADRSRSFRLFPVDESSSMF
jgi:hypothetical protein